MKTSAYLLAAVTWDRSPCRSAKGLCCRREPHQLFRISTPRTRISEGGQQRGATRDPQLLFLLMAQYSNANLQSEGAEFFSARLKEFGPRLTDPQKALYLSTIGLLRAQHAPSVSLLRRVGYVKDTIGPWTKPSSSPVGRFSW